MKILVLNAGSSSVKFQLFDMTHSSVLAAGLVEKIGESDSVFTYNRFDGDVNLEKKRSHSRSRVWFDIHS